MRGKIICLLLGVCIFFPVYTQNSQLPFTHFSAENGLSQNWILSIAQDTNGFMWFGSSDGLNRFDGYEFEIFTHNPNNNKSLRNNYVQALELDKFGRLWVGTMGGLCLFNSIENNFTILSEQYRNMAYSIQSDDKFLYVGTVEGILIYNLLSLEYDSITSVNINSSLVSIGIQSLGQSSNDQLWIGTDNGLYLFNKKTKNIRVIENRNSAEEPFYNFEINSIEIDHKNRIWVGTAENGLFQLTDLGESNFSFKSFKHDEHNSNSPSQGKILSLKMDYRNILWIGIENGGLDRVNLNNSNDNYNFEHYVYNAGDENSISNNSIYSIFCDRRNDTWIGTYGGGVNLNNSDGPKFKTIKHQPLNNNSLINNTVNVISKIDNTLLLGTEGGLSVLDLHTQKFTHYVHNEQNTNTLSSNAIWSIYPESAEKVWIGSWAGGVDQLNIKTGKVTRYLNTLNSEFLLPDDNIFSIYRDSDGDLWIATMGGGVVLVNEKTGKYRICTNESDSNSISSEWVRQVYENKAGEIWISTFVGLDIYNKEKDLFTTFYPDNNDRKSLTGNGAYAIHEDSKGTLWFGTETGLNYFVREDSSFNYYMEEDGLLNNSVKSILEDDHGNLWIGTNKGISKFINAVDKNIVPNFKNYGIYDGLQGNEFNRRSAFKDENGYMYFGGTNGFNVFHPDSIKLNNVPPPIVFTNLSIMNQPVVINADDSPLTKHISVTSEITLTHKQSVFTLEFAALNYIAPQKNQYAYKLEGFEENWNYVGTQKMATYTNLDPGEYIFMVKASNNDEIWNDKPIELVINILPPWWKSKFAIFSYMLGFVLSLLGFLRLSQSRYKEKQKLAMERQQRDQQDQLNMQKFQFFTNISHEFRTPLTLISSPLEDILRNSQYQLPKELKKKFSIIYKNANRLNRLISELMDFRKMQFNKLELKAYQQDICLFIKEVAAYFEEEARMNKIDFSLDVPEESSFIWFDAKMLEKVLFNLVSNAFKVTPEGGSIGIKLNLNPELTSQNSETSVDKWVSIEVTDTGPGLTQEQADKIFERFYQIDSLNKAYYTSSGIGLSLAKSLIDMHKGEIKVTSKPGAGSTFNVLLKKGKNHFSSDELTTEKIDVVSSPIEVPEEIQSEDNLKYLEQNKFSVLLVEDNTQLREYLKGELKLHYKVYEAINGREGIEQALKHLPDIIVSDVLMPEKDGFELCKEVKENLSISHIPVILLTAKTAIEDQILGTEAGADAYLIKPFHPRLLKSKMLQLLKSRQELFKRYSSQLNLLPEDKSYNSLDKDFLTTVTDYIIEHISDSELSVEEIGNKMNLSRSQLYRKIKSLTSYSVNEFIRIIRLEQAKKLLANGKLNVNEVGYNVGFSSPSYFSKCYRDYFGKLPSEDGI